MKSHRERKDPGHTVFGWDEEPANERPSEWGQSTYIEPASGFHRGGSVTPPRRHSRQRAGLGCGITLVFVAVLVGGVWAALRWLVPLLHR